MLADEAGIEPTSPDSEVRSETSGSSVQPNMQVTAGAGTAAAGDQGSPEKAGTKNERVGGEVEDERPSKQLRGESPKRARLAQPPLFAGNVSCIVGGEELHHGDVDQRVEFTSDEREVLHEYDNSEAFDTATEAELVLPSEAEEELLWRPGSAKEPELSQELLDQIDEVAARMEITRLLRMRVLHGLPDGEIHEEGCRFLSTKFVTSRRAKVGTVDGVKQHCWMRRARLVAREFAWLDTQRDALFSPATSTATTRIIPAVYMHKQSSGWILASADIKDAYLTVRQRIPTTISVDIGGATRGYKLLMCVPGQRDGSANWYEDLSTYVTERLETSTVAEAPTFFRSPSGDLIFNVHVDDILMAGSPEAVDNMLAVLGKKYELNVEFLRHEGDEISFLKRKHVLLPGNRLGIEAHPKHVQKMLDMLKLQNVRPRKTPLPVGNLPCDEETPPLPWEEAMIFRQCVGILLYLSGDIIEAQFGIRLLSQKMSSPCIGDMKTLKHLVSYLGSSQYRMLVYERPQVGRGFAGCSPQGELLLEAFTDSDWSSCKMTRRSVSAAAIMLDGLMVSSSSRTQRSISLSTAEAEFNAATSTMCDALYIRNILAGLLPDEKVYLRLLCDSAAARGIIAKSSAENRVLDARPFRLCIT